MARRMRFEVSKRSVRSIHSTIYTLYALYAVYALPFFLRPAYF